MRTPDARVRVDSRPAGEANRYMQLRTNVEGEIKAGRPHRSVAPWVVLGLSLLATLGAWYAAECYVVGPQRVENGASSPSVATAGDYPLQVLIGGLAVSVLLFDIALMMASTRAKALAVSELMTRRVRESEARMRTVLDYAPEGIITFDSEGAVTSSNPGAQRLFGHGADALEGLPIQELVDGWLPEQTVQAAVSNDEKPDGSEPDEIEPAAVKTVEVVGQRRDGQRFPAELTVSHMRFGDPPRWTAIIRDISERKQTEEALRRSEERYALAARAANDGLWDWNLETDTVFFSARWRATLGYGEHEIGDRPAEWLDRIHVDDRDRFDNALSDHLQGRTPHFKAEYRMRLRDGVYHWMLGRGVSVRDSNGKVVRIAGSQTDITPRKRAELKLVREALHDSLTGLSNRTAFLRELDRLVNDKKESDRNFALLFLDLDYFKNVNDSLGHHAGDQFLVAVAERIRGVLRPADRLARLGGDEFAIAIQDVNQTDDVIRVADRIQEALSHAVVVAGTEVFVTVSIGIALATHQGRTADHLIREADTAMYRAKAAGKGRCKVFDEHMQAHSVQRISCERLLRQALHRDEFVLHYQPIVSLETGRISGCEALVRWEHPERGLLLPDEFIGVAEETGLINPIGEWVLEHACHQVAAWKSDGLPPVRLAVNVSLRQCTFGNLRSVVSQALSSSGLEPHALQLEMTESGLAESPDELLKPLVELCSEGVSFSLDHFGTGSSSLMYLRRLPVSTLKIGEPSLREVAGDPLDAALASGLIALGKNLGLKLVGEGVETTRQLEFFRDRGCHELQGHLLSPAVEASVFSELLARDAREPLLERVQGSNGEAVGVGTGVREL